MVRLTYFLMLWLAVSTSARAMNFASIRKAIFKINVVSQEPKLSTPWLQNSSTESGGTGFYIGKGRILTNAHVVSLAKFITVTGDGSDKAEPAFVAYIAHDCDLAILNIKNPAILDGIEALNFSGLPQLRRQVAAIGYPVGGDQLSITEGVVSRVAFRQYAHDGYHRHLLIQIDAAINPGNSGGPVLQGGNVVGVAFQSLNSGENLGYIIPQPVVDRFLTDVEDGTYDGHPQDGILYQEDVTNNAATRFYHDLQPHEGGVKVVGVMGDGSAQDKIFPGDIILKVDGQVIGMDGRVDFQGERIDYKVLFDLRQMGDVLDYEVLRQGKRLIIPITAIKPKPQVAREHLFQVTPRFYVYCGLVFTALSLDYLKAWGRNWFRDAPVNLRYALQYSGLDPNFKGFRDIVVLASRLPHEINAYAQGYEEKILKSINGIEIKALEDIPKVMERQAEYYRFEFLGEDAPLVFRAKDQAIAHAKILSSYNVSPPYWFSAQNNEDPLSGRHR